MMKRIVLMMMMMKQNNDKSQACLLDHRMCYIVSQVCTGKDAFGFRSQRMHEYTLRTELKSVHQECRVFFLPLVFPYVPPSSSFNDSPPAIQQQRTTTEKKRSIFFIDIVSSVSIRERKRGEKKNKTKQ